MKTERPYRQTDRAVSVERTRDRILAAAEELFLSRWYDEVGVRDIADRADVATQTVLNHFGSKAGVLTAVAERAGRRVNTARDEVAEGDVEAAVAAMIAEYEQVGDGIVRTIALEGRVPELTPLLAHGRSVHRGWVERVFREVLEGTSAAEREHRTVALIVATDVLSWKVVRREQGRSRSDSERVITSLVDGLLRSWSAG